MPHRHSKWRDYGGGQAAYQPRNLQAALRLRAAHAHSHRGRDPLALGQQGLGGLWPRGFGGQRQEDKAHLRQSKQKTDEIDAENLARLARLDPKLLYPLRHRGEESQAHLALIRSREALVSTRTQLVNHVRGAVKSFGHRLPKCPARSFHKRAAEHIPEALRPALGPILEQIGSLTQRIREYDRKLEAICQEHYPETDLLRQVEGIGALTALTFVLTVEDPHRFEKSRSVGAYLGLVPATEKSGDRDPQKRISKEGDQMLRRLLVGSAHYILGPFGSDSDLRRHGEKIASRGGKNAKKRAAVAVARKLAVLLHRLWVSGELYDPLYNMHRHQEGEAA